MRPARPPLPSLGRAAALGALLCVSPTPLLAQRDVGPVRVALFGGARLTRTQSGLVGLAGELQLQQIGSLAATVSYVDVGGGGSYARYELDARWHPAQEGWLRPYLGLGAAIAHSSNASVGETGTTRVGGLAFAGVDVPFLRTTLFAEVVGIETGSFSAEVRGGIRLLVFGQ